jgi:hypothetical protein
MRKIILFLFILLLGKSGYGQNNHHFCILPGTAVASPPTFIGNSSDWQRSHGSPTWGISTMFMWHLSSSGWGEGIFQDNAFPTAGVYRVRVGIMTAPPNGRIRVFSATGLVQPSVVMAGEPIPVVTNTLIGDWTAGAVPTGMTTEWDMEFYNPYTNGQIWLYPEQTSGNAQANCQIDYVSICNYLSGITYSSGVLPSNIHRRDFFRIGSSFPGGAGVVINNIAKSTTYIASTSIDFANNTYISSTTGNSFEGKIEYRSCAGPVTTPCYIYSKNSLSNEVGRNDSSGNKGWVKDIRIFPNPNDGNFTITVPDTEEYSISITNAMGSVVYQTTISGTNKYLIKMPETIPGNYFVKISNGQSNEVKRITVSK